MSKATSEMKKLAENLRQVCYPRGFFPFIVAQESNISIGKSMHLHCIDHPTTPYVLDDKHSCATSHERLIDVVRYMYEMYGCPWLSLAQSKNYSTLLSEEYHWLLVSLYRDDMLNPRKFLNFLRKMNVQEHALLDCIYGNHKRAINTLMKETKNEA